jgi:hypothetical protein
MGRHAVASANEDREMMFDGIAFPQHSDPGIEGSANSVKWLTFVRIATSTKFPPSMYRVYHRRCNYLEAKRLRHLALHVQL